MPALAVALWLVVCLTVNRVAHRKQFEARHAAWIVKNYPMEHPENYEKYRISCKP